MKKIVYLILLITPVYLLGQDRPLSKEETLEIIEKALDNQSKIKLGTFRLKSETINNDDQTPAVFKIETKIYQDSKDNDDSVDKGELEIYSIKIDIRDGNIYDIRIDAKDNNTGEKVLFTNERPLALSNFNKRGKWRLYNIDRLHRKENINLKSILEYDYETGENYVIDKAIINLNRNNKFQADVMVKNNLKSLLDFRIYSDFLGILNEEANGIVNFEAGSLFYLFPKPVHIFLFPRDNGYLYLFKRIKPYFNYSRFDNDDRTVNIANLNLDELNSSDNILSLIQRSFIKAGGELDIFEWEPGKFSSVILYGKARVNLFVTETGSILDNDTDPNRENTSTLSWGLGVGVVSKRYSNFGISASAFWDRYQNNDLNEERALNFNTLSFNSEAFFYTGTDSDNAIFLRLNYTQGQNEISPRANFFALQFGYRAELKINRNN
ncbi:hypothetical protein GTQ40_11895 [Flavobacteriaceae bacterium R38]|nr:hypothetical protein [Flavobacteriaceae bacterium R38]